MLPENEHPEEDATLTPKEEQQAENEITAALFDAEHGSFTHLAADLPPDVLQQFLANVQAFEENSKNTVTIRSLLPDDAAWPEGTAIQSAEEGEAAIAQVEALLLANGLHLTRPDHLSPAGYYFFLTVDLMEHRIAAPVGDMQVVIDYDDVRQDGPTYMADVAEQFLMMLFDLEQPFDPAIFAEGVRLKQEVVEPETALRAVNGWRGRWQSVTPGACYPDQPIKGPDGATYFGFTIEYTTVDVDGISETVEGPGLVQLAMNPGERFWRVSGATMPGFEL